ncbi:hypothetical protein BOTBODRAFT_115244, partial [Botryobasidium botryosum FD-172 SS1]
MEFNPQASRVCSCNRKDSPSIYRCLDCNRTTVQCQQCTLDSHKHLSLHQIEKWEGDHFMPTTLFDLGHILYLGHDSEPCP